MRLTEGNASALSSILTAIEERLIDGSLDRTAALAEIADAVSAVPGITGAMIAFTDGVDLVCCATAGSAPAIDTRMPCSPGPYGECVRAGRMVRYEGSADDGSWGSVLVLPLSRDCGVLAVFSATPQGSEHITAFGTAAALASLIVSEQKKYSAEWIHPRPVAPPIKPEPAMLETASHAQDVPERESADDFAARVRDIQRIQESHAVANSRRSDTTCAVPRATLPKLPRRALVLAVVTLCSVGVLAMTYSMRRTRQPAPPAPRAAAQSPAAFTVNDVVAAPVLPGANASAKAEDITGGKLLQRTALVYPQSAMAKNIQGDVSATLVVNETGVVSEVAVSSGDPILAESAVASLSHWRYTPFRVNGYALAVRIPVTVSYRSSPPGSYEQR